MSKRLLKDLKFVKDDEEWHFTAEPEDNNMHKILATFPGPADSPYAGGTFAVEFDVPLEYPLKAPRAHFVTKVFHPNISSQTGAICLDILGKSWSPVYTIHSILISLQQLLDSPNADDPQDAQVASLYKNNHQEFVKTAKEWTAKYATAAGAEPQLDKQSVALFTQMGFPEEKVAETFKLLGLTKVSTEEDKERVVNALVG